MAPITNEAQVIDRGGSDVVSLRFMTIMQPA